MSTADGMLCVRKMCIRDRHTVVAVPHAGDEVYAVPHARRGKRFGHTGVDLSLIHI